MAPSVEECEFHKEIIRQIYFDSTLPKVIKRMQDEHGFVARSVNVALFPFDENMTLTNAIQQKLVRTEVHRVEL